MFMTTPFQPAEMYSAGKLPYNALFDMTGFFSEQARRALEGDDEMATQLFSEQFSCQQPHVVPSSSSTISLSSFSPSSTTSSSSSSSSSSSPSTSLPAAAAANYPYQPVFFESGYYQVPSYMPGYFDSASVSPVYSNHPQQQQFAMQRYTSTSPSISTSTSASPSPSTTETGQTPSPSYQTVPRLTQYPRPRHPHHYYQQQTATQQNRNNIRSSSPDHLSDCGVRSPNGTWRCAHPGCSSKTVFTRACDLRKHYNRHRKYLFCRFEGCPQSREGGFSSKKDRARHEAKHNPQITCEWQGCGRVFSRADNMKDHVRRIHCRGR